jgi:hypothetical protein
VPLNVGQLHGSWFCVAQDHERSPSISRHLFHGMTDSAIDVIERTFAVVLEALVRVMIKPV